MGMGIIGKGYEVKDISKDTGKGPVQFYFTEGIFVWKRPKLNDINPLFRMGSERNL